MPVFVAGLVAALGCVAPWLVEDRGDYSARATSGSLGTFALVGAIVLVVCGAATVLGFGWLWIAVVSTVSSVVVVLVTVIAVTNRDLIVDAFGGSPAGYSVGWGAYVALVAAAVALVGSIVALCRRAAPPVR